MSRSHSCTVAVAKRAAVVGAKGWNRQCPSVGVYARQQWVANPETKQTRFHNLASTSCGAPFALSGVETTINSLHRTSLSSQIWGSRRYAKSLAPMPDDFQVISVDEHLARIDGYGKEGFLVNGVEYCSAVVCYGSLTFAWHVTCPEQVTAESLAVLDLLRPAPDMLVIGSGKGYYRFDEKFLAHFRKLGVAVDVMSTANAASTFNILNQESRIVACALLPEWDSNM